MNQRLTPQLINGIVAISIAAILFPMLAGSPQSGDGAEQVVVALKGGVLHPPGFPLQTWLNQLFIALPFRAPSTRLAFFSSLSHAGAAFFIAEAVRKITEYWNRNQKRVPYVAALSAFAGFSYAFFPSVWFQAVQPEVFALSHFLIAAILFQATSFAVSSEAPTDRDAIALASLVGLAASQHAITVTAAPAFLTSLYLVLSRSERRARLRRFFVMALTFAFIVSFFYGSLLFLARESVWPSWGHLRDVSDLMRHVLRQEYGTFTLAVPTGATGFGGLEILLDDLKHSWNIFALLALAGLGALFAFRSPGPVLTIYFGLLTTGLVLLGRASADRPFPISASVLERFEGPTLIPSSVLLALGLGFILSRIRAVHVRLALLGGAGVAIIALIGVGWARANAGADNTSEVFRRALAASLPKDAVFLANADLESFWGIAVENAGARNEKIRFPIEHGLLVAPWYVQNVLPVLEPRLNFQGLVQTSSMEVVQKAHAANLLVASTNSNLVEAPGVKGQIRGLLFVSHPSISTTYDWQSVEGAVQLCPFIAELTPLPAKGHEVNREIRDVLFARAFIGAYEYLKTASPNVAPHAAEVALALKQAADPQKWTAHCQALTQLWKSNH